MDTWKFYAALLVGLIWGAISCFTNSTAKRNKHLYEGNDNG
jgi:hypothetical protein